MSSRSAGKKIKSPPHKQSYALNVASCKAPQRPWHPQMAFSRHHDGDCAAHRLHGLRRQSHDPYLGYPAMSPTKALFTLNPFIHSSPLATFNTDAIKRLLRELPSARRGQLQVGILLNDQSIWRYVGQNGVVLYLPDSTPATLWAWKQSLQLDPSCSPCVEIDQYACVLAVGPLKWVYALSKSTGTLLSALSFDPPAISVKDGWSCGELTQTLQLPEAIAQLGGSMERQLAIA